MKAAGPSKLISPTASARLWTISTVLFFGLTAIIFIEFAPFTGATVGAVDMTTRQTSPFVEEHEYFTRGRNTLQTDQTDTIALAATFWEEIQKGEVRTWESNLGTGMPLGGVVYTRVWSPLFWPGVVVPAPVLSSYAVWFALWIAQLGAWALARRLGIKRVGATLAGVAYGFSGPVTALLLRIHETAFAPWVLLGVHCLVARNASRSSRCVAGLSLAVAATWLGGFPAGSIFVLYGAGAIAMGTAIVDRDGDARTILRRLVLPLLAIALGTMLVAPLLIPSYEFLSVSESLDRAYPSTHAAGLPLFGSSVSGRIFGTHQAGTWWWPVRGYSNPVEASMTVGVVVLLLLWLGAFSSRCKPSPEPTRIIGRVYLPLGMIVFIGTFLGGPVLAVLQTLPFVGSNSFGRSRFLLSLVLALAAGNVMDGLLSRRRDAARPDNLFRAQCLIFVILAASSVTLVTMRAGDEGVIPRVLQSLILPLTCLAVAFLLILLLRWLRTRGRALLGFVGLGLIALLVVELQWGSWGFTPVVPPQEGFYPDHPSFDVMRPEVSDGSWRFAGTDLMVVRPDSAAWSGLNDLRASSPTYEGYRDLMRAIDPDVFERARLRTWFTESLDPSSPGLDRSAVRYLMAPGADGVLESTPAERVPLVNSLVMLPNGQTAVRGLRFEIGEEPCSAGSIAILQDGEEIGTQPLWQIGDGPFEVPLPDIQDATSLQVYTAGCSIELPTEVTVLRARSDSRLRSLWALGAVVYERLDARPRIELAKAVEGIAEVDERLAKLVSSEDTDTLILNDNHPLTELGGGFASLVEDTGDKLTIEVDSNGEGFLVVRDANAPGWQAYVDGDAAVVLAADHAYRAVEVPDGPSTVTMIYAPESRVIGMWLAAGGLFLLVVVLLGGFLYRRSKGGVCPNGPQINGSPTNALGSHTIPPEGTIDPDDAN